MILWICPKFSVLLSPEMSGCTACPNFNILDHGVDTFRRVVSIIAPKLLVRVWTTVFSPFSASLLATFSITDFSL